MFNFFSRPKVIQVVSNMPKLDRYSAIQRPSQALLEEGVKLPNAYEALQEHIDFCAKHLKFKGLLQKLNVVVNFSHRQAPYTGLLIQATADTICIKTGKPEKVTSSKVVLHESLYDYPLIDQAFEVCRVIFLHELAEGFSYDDRPAINPHEHVNVQF